MAIYYKCLIKYIKEKVGALLYFFYLFWRLYHFNNIIVVEGVMPLFFKGPSSIFFGWILMFLAPFSNLGTHSILWKGNLSAN